MNNLENKSISIIIVTHNHEKYIAKALASIEDQSFNKGKLEIIIHDDASTDKTKEIYDEFAKKTKCTIKIIQQKENKYKKKINFAREIFSLCSGEFIGFCDGDDYWTTHAKLHEQYSALRIREDVDLCFHRAVVVSHTSESVVATQGDFGNFPLLIPASHIIERWHSPIPSGSALIRKSALEKLPEWFFESPAPPVGDYFYHVYGSLRGGALYLPIEGSAYRRGDPESWTNRTLANINQMNNWEIDLMRYLPMMKQSIPQHLHSSIEKYAIKTFKGFYERNKNNIPEILQMIRSMKSL